MAISPQQRAQLARQNAKPSDANRVAGRPSAYGAYDGAQGTAKANDGSMIESDGRGGVYRYVPKFDHTYHQDANGHTSAPTKGNQLPSKANSVDRYIDQVLEMSGMNGPSNPPIPQDRPDEGVDPETVLSQTEANPGKLKDDTIGPDQGTASPPPSSSGDNSWANVAGVGGLTGIAAYIARHFFGGGDQAAGPASTDTAVGKKMDDIIPPSDPEKVAVLEGTPDVGGAGGPESNAPPNAAGTRDYVGPDRPRTYVDAKGRPINSPDAAKGWPGDTSSWAQPDAAPSNPVDESIAQTMEEPSAPKLLTDADSPYSRRNPAPADDMPVDAPTMERLKVAAQSGDVDAMLRELKAANIDIKSNPQLVNLLRIIQQRMTPNVADMVPRALGSAIRGAVR